MEPTGWEQEVSPYHAGEQELHARLGRREHQERMGRRIHRPYMPQQHRDFFAQLPFLVTGTVDAEGRPWASVLFGSPGFVASPDDRTLSITAEPFVGDPLHQNLVAGAAIGFVGVELRTRRRNRLNGVVDSVGDSLAVSVVQSFGNCPQYIQTRDMQWSRDPGELFVPELQRFTEFDDEAIAMLCNADTLFVASHNPVDDPLSNGGADVNHRGGRPGFVKVEGDALTVPDYVGNFAFNTFGNFLVDPRAGLLFIDFESGDLWQLTGTVELMWDKSAEIEAFRGAERSWRFHLTEGQRLRAAAPMRWTPGEPSPNSLFTGDWNAVTRVLEAEAQRDAWRPYEVTRIEDESSVIRSFYLQPADGKVRLEHLPGQHLTLRVHAGESGEQIRNYTVSSAPSDDHYRVSIKRESAGDTPAGLVSNHLHGTVGIGGRIEARAPRGDFWLDTAETRPAALLAGGVGITPMISMARQALAYGVTHRHRRRLTVFHAVRSTAERAFAAEFAELARASDGALRYLSVVERPVPGERAGTDYDAAGRLDAALVQSALPLADYDCYLCGPPPFMQAVYDLLTALGIRDQRIHAESFGPASLQRHARVAVAAVQTETPVESAFETVDEAVVAFERSGVEQPWTPDDGTLLAFAEAHGLNPNFGCRSGSCGRCAVPLLSGATGYPTPPTAVPKAGEVLICCAVPAGPGGRLRLGL